MRWLSVVLCLAACKGKEPRFDGPMPVTFGACAGPTTTWVSGPRPQPFTPQEADGRARELFRPRDTASVDSFNYNPGRTSPFVDHETELTECFRKNTKHYGAVVVELHYAAGKVTTATVYGLDNESATACVVAAVKPIKRGPDATAERCSVAFGDMPIADLPTIDLTDKAVTYAGKDIATTASIIADDTKTTKLADLQSAIAAQVRAALDANVVSLHGPNVLRPVDSTPMKLVVRALGSAIAAGDDFILERKNGTGWEPLLPMKFPVVPVPIGTGGAWNPVSGQSRGGGADVDEERVVLSIRIMKQQARIGLSRTNEVREVPRDASYMDKLEAALKEHKASAFFRDRTDLEIAADDDVPYGDVLATIDLVTKVGFIDWQLTDPTRPTL